MITLILIAYILLSLLFSFNNMRDTYSLINGHSKGMKKKKAFVWGFLTIPLLVLLAGLILGGLYLALLILDWTLQAIQWIYINMP
ncbi:MULTISPECIES: hypothetical protein [unclassified Bacillus cereus group]|uniref:hypothetical protein n=1 Tax=unclassified Bacillus cereus group TaxID=2750818 RepID=UPI001F55E922|nr:MULTISPECIES: hypothetical protein [unclassified Bacillus cereus group]